MKRPTYSKNFAYEMPPSVPYSLAHRHTWSLFCRDGCKRSSFVNLVTMIEKHGLDFNGRSIEKRAVCKDCGKRMHLSGGIHLDQLRACGDAATLIVADGSAWHHPPALVNNVATGAGGARQARA